MLLSSRDVDEADAMSVHMQAKGHMRIPFQRAAVHCILPADHHQYRLGEHGHRGGRANTARAVQVG